MITVTVRGVQKLRLIFQGATGKFVARLQPTMRALGIDLQRRVKGSKLSGQVLHVRTGHLRQSIGEETAVGTDAISTKVGIFGGPTEVYGRVHEFGFSGTVNVRSHLREVTQAFGRPLKSPVFAVVKAHPREVHLPVRSFVRSAFAEMEADAVARIAAVAEGIGA